MQVRDVMSAPPIFVYRETPLWRAARAMEENSCGFLPVVHRGVALGVLTRGDLARAVALDGRCPYSTTVTDVMSSPPAGLSGTEEVGSVPILMRERRVRRIVVTDAAGVLRGVVALGDLAGAVNDAALVATLRHLAESSGPVEKAVHEPWQPSLYLA